MPIHRIRQDRKTEGWTAWFTALLALCALVVVQVAPVAAAAYRHSAWVEICSENGIMLKQIDVSDENGSERDNCPECAQCPFCAMPDFDTKIIVPAAVKSGFATRQGAVGTAQANIANPAQFWPENRGPPLADETVRPRARDLAKAATFQVGDLPWS